MNSNLIVTMILYDVYDAGANLLVNEKPKNIFYFTHLRKAIFSYKKTQLFNIVML